MQLSVKKIISKGLAVKDNIFSNKKYKLSYIVENKDWIVSRIGEKLVECLSNLGFKQAKTTITSLGLRNQIIHFGSVHTFLKEKGFKKFHISNQAVLTWFHFVAEDKRIKHLLEAQKYLKIIHTSCSITKRNLIDFGVDKNKVLVIPLGVDLNLFKIVNEQKKQEIKEALSIPKNVFVIGSFQKDGVGWGDGGEPKLIKGPDIFVKAVEKISKNFPVFVLLTGPSRGYIKKELEKRNIPYKSAGFLDDYKEVAYYYNALDLYIVASRIEGGPEAIVESMACGVPLISTNMGMAPDIIIDGENGFLAEVENASEIAQKAMLVFTQTELKEKIIKSSQETIQEYSWEKIAKRYFDEIYAKLL
ncbi:MAG: glycosyltransferase [Candidatus Pacebacteria bacterium]|nr:glycosyltransferase [Candidatus Paceibacterota bacterium]